MEGEWLSVLPSNKTTFRLAQIGCRCRNSFGMVRPRENRLSRETHSIESQTHVLLVSLSLILSDNFLGCDTQNMCFL